MRGLTIYVMHTAVKMYLTEDSIIKFNPFNPKIKI